MNYSPDIHLLINVISLKEPERALEIYEEARKRNPRDTQLAAKMGQALQKTHQYGKAINYYREAVKNQDHSRLRYDLAELLMKLKTYEKAEKAIKEALNEEAKSNDLTSLISQAGICRNHCKQLLPHSYHHFPERIENSF